MQLIDQIACTAGERAVCCMNQHNPVALRKPCAGRQLHADFSACNAGTRCVSKSQYLFPCRNIAGQIEVDALEIVDIANGSALGAHFQGVAAQNVHLVRVGVG